MLGCTCNLQWDNTYFKLSKVLTLIRPTFSKWLFTCESRTEEDTNSSWIHWTVFFYKPLQYSLNSLVKIRPKQNSRTLLKIIIKRIWVYYFVSNLYHVIIFQTFQSPWSLNLWYITCTKIHQHKLFLDIKSWSNMFTKHVHKLKQCRNLIKTTWQKLYSVTSFAVLLLIHKIEGKEEGGYSRGDPYFKFWPIHVGEAPIWRGTPIPREGSNSKIYGITLNCFFFQIP